MSIVESNAAARSVEKKNMPAAAVKKSLAIFGKSVAYAVMGLFAFMAVYPLLWLLMNSFKTTTDYRVNKLNFPPLFYPQNYPNAWEIGEFATFIPNSILYTTVGTACVVLLAALAGFAFAKIGNRAAPAMFGSFVLGILLSLSSLMIPLFLQLSQFDNLIGGLLTAMGFIEKPEDFNFFYDSRIGVILVYVGSGLPLAIYMTTEYIRGIPTALIEAARIDGAGYFMIFRSIILPMCVPIITTVAIVTLPGIWNEFALINILVGKTELQTLPLGILRFSGERTVDYGNQFAALVLGLLPMLIFYAAFRRQITNGVSGGALKG